jgi:hypothetical protein
LYILSLAERVQRLHNGESRNRLGLNNRLERERHGERDIGQT